MAAKAKPNKCPNCGYSLSKAKGRPKKLTLTGEDIDVLKGKLMAGMTQGQIARQMGLSRQTLNRYIVKNVPLAGESAGL